MKQLLALVLLLLVVAPCLGADLMIISLKNPTPKALAWVAQNRFELTLAGKKHIDFIMPSNLLPQVQQNNWPYQILQQTSQTQRDLTGYHSYSQVVTQLQSWQQQYPNIVSLQSLGPTTCAQYAQAGALAYTDYADHQMWCMKVSDNPLTEEDEPNVFIGGGIHAREPIGVEVTLHAIEQLLAGYSTNTRYTSIVDSTQIWFVPLINPDGHKIVWDQTNTFFRKNLRDNNENNIIDTNSDGVDLNRNFGYVWGPNGTSSSYTSDIYNGLNAWSETETTYLRDLYQARRMFGGITYHSYAQQVLYSLGHIPGACSYDHEIMGNLASSMAATIPKVVNSAGEQSGTYTPAQAVDFGYTCQGTMGDWSYAEQRAFGFTIELAYTFIPAADVIQQICANNLEAALMFIERPRTSVLSGHLTDGQGNPLQGTIFVHGIDDATGMSEVEPYTSGPVFGRYDRALLPGTYTVDFVCPGFNTKTVTGVEIRQNSATNLNVQLQGDWVDEIKISVQNQQIELLWQAQPGQRYNIYSRPNWQQPFAPATQGIFLAPGHWQNYIGNLNKGFYAVESLPR